MTQRDFMQLDLTIRGESIVRLSRVTTDLWVAAYRKRLESEAIPVFVVCKGDSVAGSILVKVSNLRGKCTIFSHIVDLKGKGMWTKFAEGDDEKMALVIARQREIDPDIWVLEVEDREGRHLLEEFSLNR